MTGSDYSSSRSKQKSPDQKQRASAIDSRLSHEQSSSSHYRTKKSVPLAVISVLVILNR